MREFAITEIGQAQAGATESEETFHMDEESFRGFYERTARSLWAYLSRASGDPSLADDLLQDTYYRFLRAALPETTEAHRKNYLFRIATNLLRDHWRRHRPRSPSSRRNRGLSPARNRSEEGTSRGPIVPPIECRTWVARSMSSSPASASCCGWPTWRASATKRSPTRWA